MFEKSKLKKEIKKIISAPFVFPKDIIASIKKDKVVWKNYQNFSDSYKRIRVAYIDSARNRPEEFKKRLLNFIKKTKENKIIRYVLVTIAFSCVAEPLSYALDGRPGCVTIQAPE